MIAEDGQTSLCGVEVKQFEVDGRELEWETIETLDWRCMCDFRG